LSHHLFNFFLPSLTSILVPVQLLRDQSFQFLPQTTHCIFTLHCFLQFGLHSRILGCENIHSLLECLQVFVVSSFALKSVHFGHQRTVEML
ncbi:hypothetical protein PFISCL1PPCAC_6692, partial [Pristionchus fissidentatus]